MSVNLGEVPQTIMPEFPYHPFTEINVAVELGLDLFAVFNCLAKDIEGTTGKWRMREGSTHGGAIVAYYRLVSAFEEFEL